VGSLAEVLLSAHTALCDAQQQVDDVLSTLFPTWRPRFPLELGWRFVPPAEIHVYDVPDVPGALAALRFIGFSSVVLHAHRGTQLCGCTAGSPV
jgi:hypothetical protein